MDNKQKTGSILTWGKARAACQTRVLHAIPRVLRIHPDASHRPAQTPFAIICGRSAISRNAALQAGRGDVPAFFVR